MKELPLNIELELLNGLRPRNRGKAALNAPWLEELFGLKCGEYGLEPEPSYTDPFQGLMALDFPYPQIFRGEADSLLAGRTSLSRLTETTNLWTTSPLTTYAPGSPSTTQAIVEGGVWHFVDLKEAWYLFNGQSIVFKTGIEPLINRAEKIWCETGVKIQSGCYHKGRIVFGGFQNANLWSSHMQELFREIIAMSPEDFLPGFSDIGQNWVMWSSIGGGNFPLWLFMPLGYPTEYRPTFDRLKHAIRRGDFGFAPMTFQGQVQVVKALGDTVIVYGTDGVSALIPTSGGGDVPPTYGIRHLSDSGCASRGSVGGDDLRHVWLDPAGVLWRVSANLQVERLGYEEYLSPLLTEAHLWQHDPLEQDLYLGSTERSFLLTGKGLSRSNKAYTAIANWKGRSFSLGKRVGSTYAEVWTSPFDLRASELKTLTSLRVSHRGGGTVEVRIGYKYSRTGPWEWTDWVEVNEEGNAVLRITALEHKVAVRASDPSTFELDHMIPAWQAPDRRFRRGPREGTRIARDAS